MSSVSFQLNKNETYITYSADEYDRIPLEINFNPKPIKLFNSNNIILNIFSNTTQNKLENDGNELCIR